jgi:hypothetical protein
VSAARTGARTAEQIICAQAPAGLDPDRIADHHHDIAAGLRSDATTPEGRAFAGAYDDTAASLAADLRQEARQAAGARYDAAVRQVWEGISPDQGTRDAWRQADPGMRQAQRQLDRDLGAAVCRPDGQPHPDPFLAERGWHTENGVYVRRQECSDAGHGLCSELAPCREAEREAGA